MEFRGNGPALLVASSSHASWETEPRLSLTDTRGTWRWLPGGAEVRAGRSSTELAEWLQSDGDATLNAGYTEEGRALRGCMDFWPASILLPPSPPAGAVVWFLRRLISRLPWCPAHISFLSWLKQQRHCRPSSSTHYTSSLHKTSPAQ